MFDLLSTAIIIASYLIGSFSSAIIVCNIMRLPDPRTEGSGNPGTTNVLRIGGKRAAIITLLGDILKGVIPLLIAKQLHCSPFVLSLVMLAAFLGHLFPVFFKFQGGKGVATAFGAITALSWLVGFCLFCTWLLVAGIFRYSSLAAITATLFAPFYIYWLGDHAGLPAMMVMALFLLWRHRANITRLVKGSETKIKLSSG